MEMKNTGLDLPLVLFKNQKAWEAWLLKHFDSSPGLYLRLVKKAAELKSVTYQEALDVALCYGWIDGLRKGYDADSFVQRFTPRGPRSIWSKINRAKTLAFIEQGRMHAAGLAAIEKAKQNGRWDAAYDSLGTAETPPDLQKALDKSPKAKAFFAMLNSQNRYAILFRIQTAKKAETRKRRIDQFVDMLEKHETLYPPSRRQP